MNKIGGGSLQLQPHPELLSAAHLLLLRVVNAVRFPLEGVTREVGGEFCAAVSKKYI